MSDFNELAFAMHQTIHYKGYENKPEATVVYDQYRNMTMREHAKNLIWLCSVLRKEWEDELRMNRLKGWKVVSSRAV